MIVHWLIYYVRHLHFSLNLPSFNIKTIFKNNNKSSAFILKVRSPYQEVLLMLQKCVLTERRACQGQFRLCSRRVPSLDVGGRTKPKHLLRRFCFNRKVFDRGPGERRQRFELPLTQSPQDSPLLQDTPKTSRPKDKGKRKEQEQKQKLEERTDEEGTKRVRELEENTQRYVSHSRDRDRG